MRTSTLFILGVVILAMATSVYAADCGASTCGAGKYCQDSTGPTCAACSAGRYRATARATGTDNEVEATVCTLCPAGSYSAANTAGITACTACEAGKTTATTGKTAATDCTACANNLFGSVANSAATCYQSCGNILLKI